MRTDPRFQKWFRWLDVIRDDVQTLYFYRYIFQEVVEIMNKNEQLDKQSPFFGFFVRIYGDSVVMGIRRQLKAQDDSISLARLLTEVAASPELVTRSDFYEIHKNYSSPLVDCIRRDTFDRFATPDSPHIDSARVKEDLQLLKDSCATAEEYADRRIAHWDRREPSLNLTFDSISKALDLLGDLVRRYYLLFFATDLTVLPISEYPIFDIFQEPWSATLPSSNNHESA